MPHAAWSLGSGLLVLVVLGACSGSGSSQPAPAAPPAVVATVEGLPSAVASLEARFDPTAAVGGGVNASGAITPEEITRIFGSVPQAAGMRFAASGSPPGATGSALTSVSITAEDTAGTLKSLDANAKKSLGESLLNATASAWPQARITLLVTSTGGGQIIGTRPPGGPNTIIAL
jgi:hypothetical protein